MKTFHFSKIYFNKLELADEDSGIMVRVKEFPSLEVSEERYSLRISTRHEDIKPNHKNYSIVVQNMFHYNYISPKQQIVLFHLSL